MNKQERSEYNRKNYQKNKDRLNAKKRKKRAERIRKERAYDKLYGHLVNMKYQLEKLLEQL